ncbi:MAG: ABC transporter substrate-binding protein [Oscillospiraceae bacterium]|nr:ABC transporter substrate-binding protein [Oscillospiraceae bacterium]
MKLKRILAALLALLLALSLAACAKAPASPTDAPSPAPTEAAPEPSAAPAVPDGVPEIEGLVYESTVPLTYADQFAIYKYEGGYEYIDMVNSDRILIVPEGGSVPAGLDRDVVVLQRPIENVYLAATSAMALIDAVGALDALDFVGSRTWYTENAIRALETGDVIYAGKYNAPDYEMLMNGKCGLAIESTMILHNPDVREKLIEVGIPTIIERSSYEDHPLGRTEWVKVYGALFGREAEAEAAFEEQVDKVRALEAIDGTGKTVAFFYVNTSGSVVTYKTNGYVPAMIRLAGGEYVFSDLGLGDDSKLSTINMSMEQFYAEAASADVIIYNCSIASQLYTLEDLISLSPVLADFRAVREGNAWCTTDSMFQQTDKMGSIIQEMNAIFSGTTDGSDLEYMFRLEREGA